MIAATPLPTFGQIWMPDAGDVALAAGRWCREGEAALLFSRSCWSLRALARLRHQLDGRPPVIAVPEFICNQSLEPLRRMGCRLVFYAIDPVSLTPVMDTLTTPSDMMIVVHYFGWPMDLNLARSYCHSHGAWLVEDAAHVLAPCEGIGSVGDAVLYSPHKLLAIPDGAVLVLRGTLAAYADHPAMERVVVPNGNRWRLVKSLQSSWLGPVLARIRSGGQADFDGDPSIVSLPDSPAPSRQAVALLTQADLKFAAGQRIVNAQILYQSIVSFEEWDSLLPLPSSLPLYRLVMRCRDHDTAKRIYARLRAARLPVESWPDLPGEVGSDSAAWRLRRSVLLLPCHQGCRSHDLATAYGKALACRP